MTTIKMKDPVPVLKKDTSLKSELTCQTQDQMDKKSKENPSSESVSDKTHSDPLDQNQPHPLINPLLDTISTLTSNDPDDWLDWQRRKKFTKKGLRGRFSDVDKCSLCSPNDCLCSSDSECNGYSGSNSIDSGYKSLCPTPEMQCPKTSTENQASTSSATVLTTSMPTKIVNYNSTSSSQIASRLVANNSQNTSCHPNVDRDELSSNFNKLSTRRPSSSECIEADIETSQLVKSFLTQCSASTSNLNYNFVSYNFKPKIAGKHPKPILCGSKMTARLKYFNSEARFERLSNLRQTILGDIRGINQSNLSPRSTSSLSSSQPTRIASPVMSSRSSSPASTVIARSIKSAISSTTLAALKSASILRTKKNLPSSSDYSANSCIELTSLPKTVRFNKSIKVTPLNQTLSASVDQASDHSENSLKRREKHSESLILTKPVPCTIPQTLACKPILKDPLCANLRSQIESSNSRSSSSLESEIDALLYGKRYFCIAPSETDIPLPNSIASQSTYLRDSHEEELIDIPYVTMIEKKYRISMNDDSNRTMKEIRTKLSSLDGAKDSSLDDIHELTEDVEPTSIQVISYSDSSICAADEGLNNQTGSTVPKAKQACDEKNLETKGDAKLDSAQIPAETLRLGLSKPEELLRINSFIKPEPPFDTSYSSLPENHIYEEVIYDLIDTLPDIVKNNVTSVVKENIKSNNTAKGKSPNDQESLDASSKESKHRGNLYSILSDPSQRLDLAKSLETEWKFHSMRPDMIPAPDTHSEASDYGFKR